ncbi:MAG: hypothetical protein ACKVP3_04910 [Hyphomicrobiaceae bacterium]
MRFRLTYNGPLLSSKLVKDGENDTRAEHKHDIRREFHRQLKAQWSAHRFLREDRASPASMFEILPPRAREVWQPDGITRYSLPELLGPVFGHHGYQYVPLVWAENHLHCSLRILCLRRDGNVAAARDIDNRVKTVIDALAMPEFKQGSPRKDGATLPPQEGETPFFVLLDNDRQVSHLEVETDDALAVSEANPADETFVRMVITVETRAYFTTRFNLSFS